MEFLSLVVVVLAAFFTPILVNRLRITFLPIVVAEILMGIVIGHSFLNLVERDAMLNIINFRIYFLDVLKWFGNRF